MKVLLVDDSGTMRMIQRRCLNKLGIENIVDTADGRQALDLIEQFDFDVVLTDWNMPIMDGLTLLKEIRKLNTEIPVIMITTESDRARVVAAVEAGVSDYLVKPFSPDVLREKLERWVNVPS